MRKSLLLFLSAVLAGVMTLLLGSLAVSALDNPNAEVIRYRDATLDNILTLDFEGNGRDTVDSTAVTAISSSSFTTPRTWLADDVCPEDKGISITESKANFTYASVSNVGDNTGYALAHTNYYDNIKLSRSVIHLSNTDEEVNRSISYNNTAALILAEYDNSGRLIRASRTKGDPTMASSTLSCTLSGDSGTVKRFFWDLQSVQSLD